MKASKTGSIVSLVWQNDRATEAPSHIAFPFRRGALASEATFLTPAHQPKTEKNRERKRQRANRAGVGEKSQRRVADYPLHRLSNQPVFQTEIPPTASVQRTDRAKKKALLCADSNGLTVFLQFWCCVVCCVVVVPGLCRLHMPVLCRQGLLE